MESTNINAVLQKRIALRKKQQEQQKQDENKKTQQENKQAAYVVTEAEQEQLDKDIGEELALLKDPKNWTLNTRSDFANVGTLRRKLLTYFHHVLINELPNLSIAKVEADETKRLKEDNYAAENMLPEPSEVHGKSMLLQNEIKIDMLPLLIKLQENTLDVEIMISLATVVLALQKNEKNKCMQAYLDLSIGKVIWPIGVQNIGIHFKTTGHEDDAERANFLKEGAWIVALKRIIGVVFQ